MLWAEEKVEGVISVKTEPSSSAKLISMASFVGMFSNSSNESVLVSTSLSLSQSFVPYRISFPIGTFGLGPDDKDLFMGAGDSLGTTCSLNNASNHDTCSFV